MRRNLVLKVLFAGSGTGSGRPLDEALAPLLILPREVAVES
jgi:hypothetical protein